MHAGRHAPTVDIESVGAQYSLASEDHSR
eukprot:SAG11_NODE_3434_length_2450_cov_1.447044_1_plen_28_part_10